MFYAQIKVERCMLWHTQSYQFNLSQATIGLKLLVQYHMRTLRKECFIHICGEEIAIFMIFDLVIKAPLNVIPLEVGPDRARGV
jgi:hypothetical protein